MNKHYFWLCSYPLEIGSVVAPGNWGRILSLYTNQHNILLYLREQVFERVRLEKFFNRPSRLKSTFMCETQQDSIKFKQSTGRQFDSIFEIEILGNKPIFRSDWVQTNFPSNICAC